jgi:hypothetical protein
MVATKPVEADDERNRQTFLAWPQLGRPPAQGVSLRRHRGAGQQGRRQGDPRADQEAALRCGRVVRAAR